MPDIIHYNYTNDTSWLWYQTGKKTENGKHNYISKKPFDLFKYGEEEQFKRMGEFQFSLILTLSPMLCHDLQQLILTL